jgi:predicted amino acid dehydrogenase
MNTIIDILHISLGTPADNKIYQIKAFNKTFQITQLGTGGDENLLKKLIVEYSKTVSAVAISGLPNVVNLMGREMQHRLLSEIKALEVEIPIVDGQKLRELYIPWIAQKEHKQIKSLMDYNTICFFSGIIQFNYMDIFRLGHNKLIFADPYFYFRIPWVLTSLKSLHYFIVLFQGILSKSPISLNRKTNFFKCRFLKKFQQGDIFVSNLSQLKLIDHSIMKGKILVVDSIDDTQAQYYLSQGVSKIVSFDPEINGEHYSFTLMEAMLSSRYNRSTEIELDEIMDVIQKYQLVPTLNIREQSSNNEEASRRFAFLIHPLSKKDLFQLKAVRFLRNVPYMASLVELLFSHIPTYYYSTITGIKSPQTSFDLVGDIYLMPKTPKKLLGTNPKKFYEDVTHITQKAKLKGASIFGLGAYTKIVGDAGITIAHKSSIPVTTGNSLSAASTLWAATYAMSIMRMVELVNDIYQGRVMIVGATGSIGKVTAKILSYKWKEIILIAPRSHKLMQLAEELKIISPHCTVFIHTDAKKYLSSVDLIISTTSSVDEDLIPIDQVKPGTIICDVSRPFNISEKAALSRPDVLVIASGEVELPGDVKLTRTIGLHGSVVYACLAETALLTMEGLWENFSLGRDLDYQKVILIDQLARKHGVKLAAIMGHRHEITEKDIILCREVALKHRM